MVFFFGIGRVTVHTFQRKLLQKGIGLKKALIVGCGKRAKELYNQIKVDSYLGYKTLGFIETGEENKYLEKDNGIEILGSIDDLKKVIPEFEVTDVLIALDESNHNKLFDIVQQCDDFSVTLKIVPDLYDIVRGQARTNQLYGIPLIEIVPEIMPEWERNAKRIVDIWVSFFVLIIFSPIWILVALLIKLESRGPVFYRQERVGKDGRIFLIYKFRSMVQDAEKRTGPVWAGKDDPRVTRIGKIIRKLRIDEIPQFINVLDGDMSLVGPRPERPFFVEKFKKELPLYDRRLKVRPGITGWAQVNGGYDMSIDDVKKKLQYDLFYIENMSLRLDLRILFNTVFVVLTGKGH
jgi:exopolysaccharide biosynthesis polyprenyl glycosylphosphotransferase